MGCGSSKSAVAVVENKDQPKTIQKAEVPKKTDSLEHFQIKSSKTSLQKNNSNSNNQPPSTTQSIDSLIDSNNNKNKFNSSRKSLRNEINDKKPSTASSCKSGDSGVYDEIDRQSSAKSQKSVRSKPSSGKASARQRLLRIDDQALEQDKDECANSELNIVERPKTRFGNVAFDLVIDAPETGNMKKKPDSLPAIERRKKRSKKIKTKEEIDKKMKEVEERRKLQELEKQMKAKQFQHLAIHTTVQPFNENNMDENDNEQLETSVIS